MVCGERRKKKKEHSINSLLVVLRHLVRSVLQKNCNPKTPSPPPPPAKAFGSERGALWEDANLGSECGALWEVTNLEGYRRLKWQVARPPGQ